MTHSSRTVQFFQWPVIPFLTGALLSAGTLPLIATAAQAQATDQNYGACADELLAAGVDADAAATARSLERGGRDRML